MKKNEPVQINAAFQDRDGAMWFGTAKGLFRFDGKKYLRLTTSDSLPDMKVTALAADSTGRVWIGHQNGTLAYIEHGVITKFKPHEGSAASEVSDILFDKKGNLWFSTLNDGLYYFINNRLYRLDEQEGMPDLFVYDIIEDDQGNIWAGTDGGVAICTLKNNKAVIDVLNYDDGLPDNIVKKLAMTPDNRIWMATEDAGVVGYNLSTKTITRLLPRWPYGPISDFILKDEKLWVSSQAGLTIVDPNTTNVKHYNSKSVDGLSSIYTLFDDAEGNIWIGTKTGLMRTPGDHLEFIENLAPANNPVLAVAADNDQIWFSTREGLFKRTTDEFGQAVVTRQLTPQRYTIISLFIDPYGYLWAGLYGDGVLRIDPRTGTSRLLNKELRNGNVLHITGRGNEIWLATLGGCEKIRIEGEKLSITNYNSQNGLSSDFIYQVFIDSKNRVWFATDGKGVDMMDSNGFHHMEAGLASKVVYGFAEDNANNIWANVQGSGLYVYTAGQFKPQEELRLRDNNVNCFAADRYGNLIAMHDLGMDIYNVQTNKVRHVGEEYGMRDRTATLNAIASGNAQLLIATNAGIIRFTPYPEAGVHTPNVAIEAIRVFDQKVSVPHDSTFRHDENSITINFVGYCYHDPSDLHFLYKMDNYDTDWIGTGDNAVTYSRLPPGTYTFHVKVSDNGDFSHARQDTVSFTINPPFWRTAIFYVLVAMFVIFISYTFIEYREKKLRDDKAELEAKVEERTQEILRKTEEIKAQNEEIIAQKEEIKGINENLEMLVQERTAQLEKKNQALAEYAFINAHKLRSPVASILGLINLISKTDSHEEANVIKKHLQQSADELDEVVRSITKAIERGDHNR